MPMPADDNAGLVHDDDAGVELFEQRQIFDCQALDLGIAWGSEGPPTGLGGSNRR